jgi:hypothetical protein
MNGIRIRINRIFTYANSIHADSIHSYFNSIHSDSIHSYPYSIHSNKKKTFSNRQKSSTKLQRIQDLNQIK